jgi:hypothetical protein
MTEKLRSELASAEAELRRHMASWEYAFAMGSSCHGQGEHPDASGDGPLRAPQTEGA